MLHGYDVNEARKRAQRSKQGINRYLGSKELCDCKQCWGVVNRQTVSLATIATHRSRYGRHVPKRKAHDHPPVAGPSRPRDAAVLPQPELPLRSSSPPAQYLYDQLALDNAALINAPGPRLDHRSRSRSRSRSQSRSVSSAGAPARSYSPSSPRAGSRSGITPESPPRALAQRQRHISRSSSQSRHSEDEGEPELHFMDDNADADFFAHLLEDDNIAPPPLLRGGSPAPGNVGPENGDESEGEGGEDEDAGEEDRGDEREDGEDEGGEGPNPLINVDPLNHEGDPEEPEDDNPWIDIIDEHPVLRNIYLRTWVEAAFSGATNSTIQSILESHKLSLEATAGFGGYPEELLVDLPKMARTLRSLERRIGMDFSDAITIYALCPKCGTRYTMEQINRLPHPQCQYHVVDPRCNGVLYAESTLANGKRKRTPFKTFPYVSLIAALGRLLSRPGIPQLIEHWRLPGDAQLANVEPLGYQHWVDSTPIDRKFGDITQGWGWEAQPTGLQRSYDEVERVYADVPIDEHTRPLARSPLGLSLGMNIDGFQAFHGNFTIHGNYSATGVYLIVHNLPFHLRTLTENMILAIVVPGPKEPKGYAMDQIMELVVNDLIRLQSGIELPVFNQDTGEVDLRVVYGTFSTFIVDWKARIKCIGHMDLTAEHNHCIYCKMRQCRLALEEGYYTVGYEMRNSFDHLQLKHAWLRAPEPEREAIRIENGTSFNEFDRIPGYYSFDNAPIDAMHLFDHGVTSHLVREIVYKPGMLRKRFHGQQEGDTPEGRFNAFVQRTYFPPHCGRLPPKIEKMGKRMKAEQWKTLMPILPAAFLEAWRVRNAIPNDDIPRGGTSTRHFKTQKSNANKVLARRVQAHYDDDGDPDLEPTFDDCASSRNPRDYLRNIMRYCVAYSLIFKHRITRAEVAQAQALLERFCMTWVQMNIHLTPSFHAMTHVGAHILRFGSVYNTWAYDFERANRVLVNVNTNGHGSGTLETTMAKGFLRRAQCYQLVKRMQSIQAPSRDDLATIDVLLKAVRNGPEHERQRGMLNAVLAGQARFQGQEELRLATAPAQVNFQDQNHEPYYQLMVDFCTNQLEDLVFYAHGRRPPGGVYFAPRGTTLSYPNLFRSGIRYGSSLHHRGKRARYGYIHDRVPVIIRRIYKATLVANNNEHTVVAVMIQRFVRARRRPVFPWQHWEAQLGIDAWAYNELGPLEAVDPMAFSGVFALSDIEMTYGHYWLTFAMAHTNPEDRGNE